jgi:hypothetical protein
LQHWQQQQQQQAAEMQAQQGGEGPASAGGLGESGMSLVLQALNDPEIMSFAKLVSQITSLDDSTCDVHGCSMRSRYSRC